MTITLEQFQKTAALAYLDNKDAEMLLDEANLILNQINNIHKIDVTDIEPLIHPIQTYQFLRDDVVSHTNCVEALAAVAPEFVDNHFVVPKHMRER